MAPSLESIELSTEGQVIRPSANVTLIVGPNNAGKSAVLQGAHADIVREPGTPANMVKSAVASVSVSMPELDEVIALLERRGTLFAAGTHPHGVYYEPTYVLNSGLGFGATAIAAVQPRSREFGNFGNVIALAMGPEGRGQVLQSQNVPDLTHRAGGPPRSSDSGRIEV